MPFVIISTRDAGFDVRVLPDVIVHESDFAFVEDNVMEAWLAHCRSVELSLERAAELDLAKLRIADLQRQLAERASAETTNPQLASCCHLATGEAPSSLLEPARCPTCGWFFVDD